MHEAELGDVRKLGKGFLFGKDVHLGILTKWGKPVEERSDGRGMPARYSQPKSNESGSESDAGMVTEGLAIGASERKIKRDEIGRREA
jgi:hypothetical protein